MNKSKYNNMFKVSPIKRNFLDTKTGIPTNNSFHELCKYDVHDEATYDMNGNFIEYGEQTLYNTSFLIILSELNILEVKDFFNYHYDYTPNKETFLDYLEFGILNDKSIYVGIKELCKKLIDEKRKELSEHFIRLKDTIIQFLKDDLMSNYKEWNQKLNNPLATELQYLEIEKTKCENAISKAKELNTKLYHGEPSNLLYKETNELTKLKIINERIKELSEPQQSIKESESLVFNARIFTSLKGFNLFDKLVKKCPKVSDTYSFIYLQLVKDGYIFEGITHKEIKDFFNSEPYKITIDKIKTLNVLVNPQRMAFYSSVLDSNK